jgi:predicted cupin superfamily sugar epimerase
LDEERKIKEEKAKEVMRRKEAVRNLSLVSEERAPGTRYDRFFFDEFTKKIKETSKIEEIIERLKVLP